MQWIFYGNHGLSIWLTYCLGYLWLSFSWLFCWLNEVRWMRLQIWLLPVIISVCDFFLLLFLTSEEGIEIEEMMENKRSPCSVDHSSFTSLASKRQKADLSISTKVFSHLYSTLYFFSVIHIPHSFHSYTKGISCTKTPKSDGVLNSVQFDYSLISISWG